MRLRIQASLGTLLLAVVLALTPVAFASANPAVPTGTLPGIVGGSAYAGYLAVPAGSLHPAVGPLVPVDLGCSVTPTNQSATAPKMNLSPVASSGAVTTQVSTTRSTTSATITATTDVKDLNVLSGLITADEVINTATTSATSSTATSTGSTTFNNLKIAGTPVGSNPSPNTQISLPGLGYVILNEVNGPINKPAASHIKVMSLDVHVTLSNTKGLAVGVELIIGLATSSYQRTAYAAVVSALANAMYVTGLTGTTRLRPFAEATVPCTGGSQTTDLSSPVLPSVLSSGSLSSSASGVINDSSVSSTASSTAHSFGLLSGLITFGDVSATASATITGSVGTTSGSATFTNPMINGKPVPTNPKPNTVITLPGLGKAVLNEQSMHPGSSSSAATVVGLDIYITQTNLLGLPVGSRILVCQVKATVTTF